MVLEIVCTMRTQAGAPSRAFEALSLVHLNGVVATRVAGGSAARFAPWSRSRAASNASQSVSSSAEATFCSVTCGRVVGAGIRAPGAASDGDCERGPNTMKSAKAMARSER